MGAGKKLAIGAVIGAAIGVAAGILTAPKSGRETRDDIRRKANDAKDKAAATRDDALLKAEEFADEVLGTLGATVQIAKRNELHTFEVIPQRWIVERSFAWLEKCRRLWKNCERELNTSLQFVHLAFLSLVLRRF